MRSAGSSFASSCSARAVTRIAAADSEAQISRPTPLRQKSINGKRNRAKQPSPVPGVIVKRAPKKKKMVPVPGVIVKRAPKKKKKMVPVPGVIVKRAQKKRLRCLGLFKRAPKRIGPRAGYSKGLQNKWVHLKNHEQT